jgi:hypothetical protein
MSFIDPGSNPFLGVSTGGTASTYGGFGSGGQYLSGSQDAADQLYGSFQPFGDPNVNQGFEVPGGGLGGFASPGAGSTAGSMTGASSQGATPGNTTPTESASSASGGLFGAGGGPFSGGSWNPLCILGGTGCGPSSSAAAGSSSSTCGFTNLSGCFPSIGDFATRAAVVVLGFIFVAAGLFMFGRTVPFVRHAVPNVLKP